jgi:hypothetical protein
MRIVLLRYCSARSGRSTPLNSFREEAVFGSLHFFFYLCHIACISTKLLGSDCTHFTDQTRAFHRLMMRVRSNHRRPANWWCWYPCSNPNLRPHRTNIPILFLQHINNKKTEKVRFKWTHVIIPMPPLYVPSSSFKSCSICCWTSLSWWRASSSTS